MSRGFRSLRGRLLAGTGLVLTLVMAAVTVVVEHRQRDTIVAEFERRGEVLARNLAAISTGPLLLYNYTALEQNVARVAAETDVVYALVLDAQGQVAAHSAQPERVGTVLTGPVHERAARAERLLAQDTELPGTGEPVYDVAVPVVVGQQRWGTVRVGLSKQRMLAEVQQTRLELALLAAVALLAGGAGAWFVARRIVGPVQQLAASAAAIARGELNQRIEPATTDEIGRLAAAFNHMAAELAQQRAALEAAHGELRQRFEELADLKSYTDSILASVTSGIITVDLDGRVVTVNPAAELLTGYFAGEAVGRYCTEVFATTSELGELLMQTLASRSPLLNVSITLRRRTGVTMPVEVSTAPLRGGDGKVLGAVGIVRDLTPVRRLESQLRRSDRLAALGTLAAGLAHEIKTPLTSVLTFSRHLTRRFDDPQFRARFERVVPRELERINEIVERLLELARPSRLNLALVRLPALLERVLELYAHEMETRGIGIVREYARDLPPLRADEEGLYRTLVNVVGNAVDAMPAGGRLTLRLGWDEEARSPGRRPGAHLRAVIEVQDTGVGIAPEDTERVFNPFFTTKPGGTGLGLALSHKIVEEHGGAIELRSAPGAGTLVRIVLPLAADPPEAGEDVDRPD